MRRLLRRAWYVLRARRREAELREELAFHRAMKQQELEDAGADAARARLDTQRALGNDLAARDRARDVWMWPWLQDLRQDVRGAARLLLKERRFTLAAVAALSLGLGAATTAFTFVNGAALRDLPLADADRLVVLRTVDGRGSMLGASYADARDWRAASRTLSHVVISLDFAVNVVEDGLPPQRYHGSFISVDAFGMVGAAPILGRGLLPEDDRRDAPRVALIAHTVWRSRYAGDPSVVGRTVKINDVPTTIVGVLSEGFHFPAGAEVWVPVAHMAGPPDTIDARRGNRAPLWLGLARLATGVTLEQAQAEMDAITSRLAREHPSTNAGISVAVEPLDRLYRGDLARMLWLVLAAVVVVLLIACVNVANLLLARSFHRSREIAIRSSLGATRWRLVRQLFIESLLLTAVAGAVSFVLALYGVASYTRLMGQMMGDVGPRPFWLNFAVDGPVYAFLAAACLGTALLFGLAPALHASRPDTRRLRDGGPGSIGHAPARRWTDVLMVVELALTLVLLAGAGLLLRSFLAVQNAGRAFDTSSIVTAQVTLSTQKYPQPAHVKQFFQRLDERLGAAPQLSAATVASDIPMRTTINAQRQMTIEGRATVPDTDLPSVAYVYVGPRYFQTLRIPIVRGRDLTAQDGAPGHEGVIVNQRLVSMFFQNGDPIGQRIRLANPASATAPRPWFTIVGVVPSVPQIVVRERPEPLVYVPVGGEPAPHRFVSVLARADLPRADVVAAVKDAIREADADLPAHLIRTMDEVMAESYWQYRVFGSIFGLLATIAIVLASVGLFAMTAHGVVRRTPEIGVRVALGARAAQVVWLLVRRTVVQLAIGLSLGLAGAMSVGGLLARHRADPFADSFLVNTAPGDPLALGVVSALLVAVTLAASAWPARRATRIDPVAALRSE